MGNPSTLIEGEFKGFPVKMPRLTLRRYSHSAMSKYVVNWSTGAKPTRIQTQAWKLLNPKASPAELQEFATGTWPVIVVFSHQGEGKGPGGAQEIKLGNEGRRAMALPDEVRVHAVAAHAKLKPPSTRRIRESVSRRQSFAENNAFSWAC